MAALARATTESHEIILRDLRAANAELRAENAALRAQTLRHQTAFDNISQGVCLFDGKGRLILCNRRYAEIFRLSPDQVTPGATLREITERRTIAGTSPMDVESYLAWSAPMISSAAPTTRTTSLRDGRTVRMHHQPMPDGGWVATHEDVTELQGQRAADAERISQQTLIDWVPDILWVKDVESRFVIANKAAARRIGLAGVDEMIGKNDFELHPPETAQQYFADEQRIIQSGQPLIDKEEYVIDASGEKTWILTTKIPLRNEKGAILGLVGVSRDITARRLADALRNGQAKILEMIATSAPLETVLEHLVRLVESQLTGTFGSIMLLDEDGLHLRHGAAPSLASDFVTAVDGALIGPEAGSCGIGG